MKVSIVILNYFHPEVIEVCLKTLAQTNRSFFLDYEVVVVDNGSDAPTITRLYEFKEKGWIDVLVELPTNEMFAGGNNAGVHAGDQEAECVLLLNSDVAFLKPNWLEKAVEWLNGVPAYEPNLWATYPTHPSIEPRDILSIGWSHDGAVEPGHIRPEGWCCMIRRSVWTDISTDFPWHYGLEEMLANAIKGGARCGVLFNYAPYMIHREGGSAGTGPKMDVANKRTPDIPGWYNGLHVESLDFTLGEFEHSSYLNW